jgi:hypothetical protein
MVMGYDKELIDEMLLVGRKKNFKNLLNLAYQTDRGASI